MRIRMGVCLFTHTPVYVRVCFTAPSPALPRPLAPSLPPAHVEKTHTRNKIQKHTCRQAFDMCECLTENLMKEQKDIQQKIDTRTKKS
jgi:hypothetical protein